MATKAPQSLFGTLTLSTYIWLASDVITEELVLLLGKFVRSKNKSHERMSH